MWADQISGFPAGSCGAPWSVKLGPGGRQGSLGGRASAVTTAKPDVEHETWTDDEASLEPGYLVIVWNDPVNLMSYVTHVFMKVFGWNKAKAEQHMLQVHEKGKSVVARESLEKDVFYVHQLQKYALQATMEPDR